MYGATLGSTRYTFGDLKTLMAKATPLRSGDQLAGLAAQSGEERVAAQFALADLPLTAFLNDAIVPYESDEITRLILDHHDREAFKVDRASHRRSFPRLSALRRSDHRDAHRSRTRHHAGNGRSRRKDQPRSGPDRDGGEMLGRHAISQHDRPARPALGAAAAQSSDRRSARHRRFDSRRTITGRRGRGDRHQSRYR